MSVAGKREGITQDDLLAVAREMNINKPQDVIHEVKEAVGRWPEFAAQAQVEEETAVRLGRAHLV
jgi:serine/threonine-protein kinase HipA